MTRGWSSVFSRLGDALLWRRLPLGRRGERIAAARLRREGYRILARNVRNRFGEIDLVAEAPDRRTVVVVEVKAGLGLADASDEAAFAEIRRRKDAF